MGREYGSSGSDLSCALTRWSRRFLALRLPKVTWVEYSCWVEGVPSRCQFSWSVSWKMVHDGWYVCYSKEWIFVIGWGGGGGRGRGSGGREKKGVAVLGEGADEGILQEVIRIASVQEVRF